MAIGPPLPRPASVNTETWERVRRFMRDRCAVTIEAGQSYLLESRLGPVARKFNQSIDAFVVAATSPVGTEELRVALIDAMTTHETFFFRDTRFWEEFEKNILATLLSTEPAVRIWSAACSTGQEPYSIAMLVQEKWPSEAHRVRIVATDVSAIALQKAKSGMFTTLEVNRGLNSRRLITHFQQAASGFQIRPALQQNIEWRVQNVVTDMPPGLDFHIVLCRNVLIYFDETTRATALRRLVSVTRPNGFIGVGGSELLPAPPVVAGWYRRPPQEKK